MVEAVDKPMKFCRLLQLTDIHLMSDAKKELKGVNPEESLKKVIDDLLLSNINPDMIVVTGDLSEDGSNASYVRLKKMLFSINAPVFVLPGNHDSVENMRTSLLGGVIKMEHITTVNDWQIIFLNSQFKRKDYGMINKQDMLMLQKNLDKAEKPCVLAVHHSPISGCQSTSCQLQNKEEFLDLISAYKNVKAVLSGHTHQRLNSSYGSVELLTAPSTFLQVAHPQLGDAVDFEDFKSSHLFDRTKCGYRVIDLWSNGTLNSEVYWVKN